MLASGSFDAALDVFRGLVAAAPKEAVFRTYLAATLVNLEQHEEALREYGEAITLAPKDVDARVGRGELLLRSNRVPEALQDFEVALKEDPDCRRPSTNRARLIIQKLSAAAQAAQQKK